MRAFFARVSLYLILLMAIPSFASESYEVKLKTFPNVYQFDAVIEAVNEATVSSRIAAQVTEIHFDVDDHVPKDALLIKFRDTEFKARLAQATSNLQAEHAQLQEALARQKEATAEEKRMSDLYERRQVTKSALDKAQADKAAADARVSVLSAQIKVRQAQVEEAQISLSYTTVQAPYAGIVTQRHIEVGEMATPGQLLMSGISLNALRAVVDVPQRLIKTIAKASQTEIQTEEGWDVTGSLTIIPEADKLSHSFTVRVVLDEGFKAYPGMMTKVRFLSGEEDILAIPKGAIVRYGEISGIYVLAEAGKQYRQIRVGRELSTDWVEVLSGVGIGEKVIISSPDVIEVE